ncbi:chorismate-binding protein [Flavobacterium sp.]|jgi:isochorismate synthase|uniref:chorismate-binding protein n=1 Tax=Flavobacterium sp. TaxID=239 RepID=UPI002A7FC6A8|nr:chorismate-binding protein [Flavobacterium sp.]
MTNLFEKVKHYKEQNLPFVIYSKPNSDQTIGLFQKDNQLYGLDNFEAKGFVFAPFDQGSTCFIPKEFSEIIVAKNNYEVDDLPFINNTLIDDANQNQQFEELVEKAIQNINLNLTEKIVVSRKETVSIDSFDIEIGFKRMLSLYKSAFKYCFFHPKVGMWMGATPEQFLKIKNNKLKTVSLAGTRLINDNDVWGEKEIKEQQYVTDFIVSNIIQYVSSVDASKPYTITAGNIQHIKTDIEGTIASVNDLEAIIKTMHPTPAVCGFPKEPAKDFILKNEQYNRKYYAGFLGELNFCFESNQSLLSDLFVNLRCMELKDTTAEIYIGCGITKDSNPEKEYIETKNKSVTMKNILNK